MSIPRIFVPGRLSIVLLALAFAMPTLASADGTNQPPMLSVSGPGAIQPGSVGVWNANASDPEGTPVTVNWKSSDGGSGNGTSFSHTFAAEGGYTLNVTATDADGFSTTKTLAIVVDGTAPSIAIVSPALRVPTQPWVVTTTQKFDIVANASDGLSGIARVQFALDGTVRVTVPANAAGSYVFTFDGTRTSLGIHSVVATAFDAAGNKASDQITFLNA